MYKRLTRTPQFKIKTKIKTCKRQFEFELATQPSLSLRHNPQTLEYSPKTVYVSISALGFYYSIIKHVSNVCMITFKVVRWKLTILYIKQQDNFSSMKISWSTVQKWRSPKQNSTHKNYACQWCHLPKLSLQITFRSRMFRLDNNDDLLSVLGNMFWKQTFKHLQWQKFINFAILHEMMAKSHCLAKSLKEIAYVYQA